MANRNVVGHSDVSFVFNFLRHLFVVLDILPVLASIYISFVFAATVITLVAPYLSNLFLLLGLEAGLMGIPDNGGHSFGLDFRKANIKIIHRTTRNRTIFIFLSIH